MKTVPSPEVSNSHLDAGDIPDVDLDIDVEGAKAAYAKQIDQSRERAECYARFMVNGDHRRKKDPKHFVSTVLEWADMFASYNHDKDPLSKLERNWLRGKKTTPMPESLIIMRDRWQVRVNVK